MIKQESHTKALELACLFYNRCQDLQEIIEMFCMDAEMMQRIADMGFQWPVGHSVILETTPRPNPLTGWTVT